MNRAKNVTSTTLAHEFGHAIGLNDLYDDQNVNKLMYGVSSRTVSSPTTSDKWGAKVITGVHTTHTWAYKYHSTTGTGQNRHVGYCTSCNGVFTTPRSPAPARPNRSRTARPAFETAEK